MTPKQEEFELFYGLLTPENEATIIRNILPDWLRQRARESVRSAMPPVDFTRSTEAQMIALAEQCANGQHKTIESMSRVITQIFPIRQPTTPASTVSPVAVTQVRGEKLLHPSLLDGAERFMTRHKKTWRSWWCVFRDKHEPLKEIVGFDEAVGAINLAAESLDKT